MFLREAWPVKQIVVEIEDTKIERSPGEIKPSGIKGSPILVSHPTHNFNTRMASTHRCLSLRCTCHHNLLRSIVRTRGQCSFNSIWIIGQGSKTSRVPDQKEINRDISRMR
jgi:hypothetical protein